MSRVQDKPPPLQISHAIARVFREQNRLHGRAAQPFGLSTEQAHLLVVLWAYGPMTMTALGREVALSSGTLSAAVDRMEAARLVKRIPDRKDRRSVRVEPADWDPRRKKTLLSSLRLTERDFLAPLSVEERTVLYGLLTRILDRLENPRPPKALPRSSSEPT
jgi:DNA-binding MarR family transcriptional regulator